MQGFQYGHIETYSRKGGKSSKRANGERSWTVTQAIEEAAREPWASTHVTGVSQSPIIIPGTCRDFDELRMAHDEACKAKIVSNYTNPKTKKKTTRKKSVRQDAHTLYSSVFSVPVDSVDALADPELMNEGIRTLRKHIEWEVKRLEACGGEFALAVVHTDEAKLHAHVLAIDRQHGSINWLHPGKAAVDEIRRANLWKIDPKMEIDRAYCDAMRGWQDDLYENVSRQVGLMRFGPKRTRMTRKEYNRQRAAHEAYAETQADHERKNDVVECANNLYEAVYDEYQALDDNWSEIQEQREALNQANAKLEKERAVQASKDKELELKLAAISARETALQEFENQTRLKRQETDGLLSSAKEKQAEADRNLNFFEVQSNVFKGLVEGRYEWNSEFECVGTPEFEIDADIAPIIKESLLLEKLIKKDPKTAYITGKQYLALKTTLEEKAFTEAKELQECADSQIAAIQGFVSRAIWPDNKEKLGYKTREGVSIDKAEPYLARISRQPKAAKEVANWILDAWKKIAQKYLAADAKLASVEALEHGFISIDLESDADQFVELKGKDPALRNQISSRIAKDRAASRGILKTLFSSMKKATQKATEKADKRERMLTAALQKVESIVSLAASYMSPSNFVAFHHNVEKISNDAQVVVEKSMKMKSKNRDDDER